MYPVQPIRLLLTLCCALLFCGSVIAQLSTTPPVRAVVVYPKGAYVLRADTLSLEAGAQTILIDKLETSFYVETVQLSLGAEVRLERYRCQVSNVISDEQIAQAKRLQVMADSLHLRCAELQAELAGVSAALDVLAANRTVTASAGAQVNELIMLRSKDYAARVQELEREKLALDTELKSCQQRAAYLTERADKLLTKSARRGQISMEVNVPEAGIYVLTLAYLNPDASWSMEYDLHFPGVDSAYARRVLSASVRQHTSVSWDSVAVELNTGNPLTFRTLDELRNHRQGKLTRLRDINLQREESMAVSSIRGGRTNATQYVVDGIRVTGQLPPEIEIPMYYNIEWFKQQAKRAPAPQVPDVLEHVTLAASSFRLPGSHTLGSQAGQLTLKLNQRRLPVSYRYRAQPLLAPVAYLEAVFADSTLKQLDFAGRNVRLYHEGNFIGSTLLERPTPERSLTVGLGPNEQVTAVSKQAPGYPIKRFWGGKNLGINVYLNNNTALPVQLILEGSGIRSEEFIPRLWRCEVDGVMHERVPSLTYTLVAGEQRTVEVRWKAPRSVD